MKEKRKSIIKMAVEKLLDNPSAYGLSKQKMVKKLMGTKKLMDLYITKKEVESFFSKEEAEVIEKLRSALEIKDHETKK